MRQITQRQAEIYESYRDMQSYDKVAEQYDTAKSTVQSHVKTVEEQGEMVQECSRYDTLDELLDDCIARSV